MMAPINPVAPSAFETQEQDWVRPAQPARSTGRWRVLAPALSGISVIAIVLGVTLAGGTQQRPSATGGSDALPKFYVTINGLPPKETAIVHSTATGRALSWVHLAEPSGGTVSVIAAARSDREFYLAASVRQPKSGQLAMGILRLSLSADGRSAKVIRLPVYVVDPNVPHPVPPFVYDLAVSPDGRELAAMIDVGTANANFIKPLTELMLIPTHPGGHPAFWRAKTDFAYGFNVNWISNHSVAFVWQDHFKGNPADFTSRSAVRLLNLRTSKHELLNSKVMMQGNGALGVIQNAYAAPGGGPIIASLARDTPATGRKGTTLVRLVATSPATGKITKVFASRVLHYRTDTRRYLDDDTFSVHGLDASGKDALVEAPRFGMIRNGIFTALPMGRGTMYEAAW
jgi:hypothetical protein